MWIGFSDRFEPKVLGPLLGWVAILAVGFVVLCFTTPGRTRNQHAFFSALCGLWLVHLSLVGYTFFAVDGFSLSGATHHLTFAEARRLILPMYLDAAWMTILSTVGVVGYSFWLALTVGRNSLTPVT